MGGSLKTKKGHKRVVLTDRQELFIARYLTHGSSSRAVREANYPTVRPFRQAQKLLKNPLVVARIKELRDAVTEKTTYDATVAMEECKEGMKFARETNNANALAKFVELRSKLQGLLIEKHDVRTVGSLQINIAGIAPPEALPSPTVVQQLSAPTQEIPEGEVVYAEDEDIEDIDDKADAATNADSDADSSTSHEDMADESIDDMLDAESKDAIDEVDPFS